MVDLLVGVSNDAVNFLNSSIGCKAAKFKTILFIAAVGVFVGASTSNGMMDIARHGIMHPSFFSFNDVICIFLAVMVTDVVLLDVFNTLGMPTSTTVSMVFELLGGTFILALLKIYADDSNTLTFGDLVNTDKALSVIIGIFLSVLIAFVVGTTIQFIVRCLFTFKFNSKLNYLAWLFGGIAITAIVNFLLINGLKSASFMTAENKQWIHDNTLLILSITFFVSAVLMQSLQLFGVNILKIIVLLGTFSLAVAFAGNDLVNFIGVPLASLSAYSDYIANGNGDANGFLMSSLDSSAKTPIGFLLAAGAIMVFALVTSKKAHNVVKTELGLSKQNEGDEMFGSSAIARSIVRGCSNFYTYLQAILPKQFFEWLDTRFNKDEIVLEEGAVYDQLRASVNLIIASILIAIGTSLKLPLSTTYVTFIVAMGTSLSDRAWGRESAVFRITGMISVIGGWLITAAVAFCISAIVACCMHYGGFVVMTLFVICAIILLIRSLFSFNKKVVESAKNEDALFEKMVRSNDKDEILTLLKKHSQDYNCSTLDFVSLHFTEITNAFFDEDIKTLRLVSKDLKDAREREKRIRRRELICLRKVNETVAIKKNTWFHLYSNCDSQMLYCLFRLIDPCKEHVDNNFKPLPEKYIKEFLPIRDELLELIQKSKTDIETNEFGDTLDLLNAGDFLKDKISDLRHRQENRMQYASEIRVELLYLNILQETQELTDCVRHQLRACRRFLE